MENYKVISTPDLGELEETVNTNIDLGYSPIGGITTARIDGELRYLQALLLKASHPYSGILKDKL